MHLSELDYELPEELIAQHPPAQRDQSRLMLINRADQSIQHLRFENISEILQPGDRLILNDTKVRACRLYATRAISGGRVELFLLEDLGGGVFHALTRAGGKLAESETLHLGDPQAPWRVTLAAREEGGVWRVEIRSSNGSDAPSFETLEALGRMPLPPYIKRTRDADDPFQEQDRERYQTVFAQHPGAVAAPTAGLHFTPELLAQLQKQGIEQTHVTLHVGVGTFRPVSVSEVEDHPMHHEEYLVSAAAAAEINATQGRRIAVGSTSTRTLESIADEEGCLEACRGSTDLMILPGYSFRAIQGMLTNFHLPKSTLLALVMAFAGKELTREAYRQAVQERYRFFSYGDAMLIL